MPAVDSLMWLQNITGFPATLQSVDQVCFRLFQTKLDNFQIASVSVSWLCILTLYLISSKSFAHWILIEILVHSDIHYNVQYITASIVLSLRHM